MTLDGRIFVEGRDEEQKLAAQGEGQAEDVRQCLYVAQGQAQGSLLGTAERFYVRCTLFCLNPEASLDS